MITVAAGQPIRATHVNQFSRWLTGVTKDTPFTPVTTSASAYTATLTNEDTSAGLIADFIYGVTHVMTVNKTAVTINVPVVASGILSGLFSSAGQLLYGSGGTSVTTLNIGAAYQSLNVNAAGTAPAWMASIQSLMASAGSLVVASGANTPAHLPRGTGFQEFIMNGAATGQTWATGFLASVVTAGDLVVGSALNTASRLAKGTVAQELVMATGATGQTWATGVLALATTAGDLFYATGLNAIARLAIGTSGQFLTTNGTSPSWGGGPSAGITLLASAAGTGTSGTFTFTSISASYRQLYLVVSGRSNATGTSVTVQYTFEGSPTAGAYDYGLIYPANTTPTAGVALGSPDYVFGGFFPAATSTAGLQASSFLWLTDYAGTSVWKSVQVLASGTADLSLTNMSPAHIGGVFEQTGAVTTVKATLSAGSWTADSKAALYGITAT